MANYKIYGTNQPYTGNVVNINGDLYTTIGGTLEGDSKHVVLANETSERENLTNPTPNPTITNPIVRTFTRGDGSSDDKTYYLPMNYSGTAGKGGRAVKQGTLLHVHANGTVMTEHSMGSNDNSVVVTTSRPRATAARNTQRTAPRNNRTSRNTRTPRNNMTSNNRNGGNSRNTTRRTGGTNMGGSGGY